METSKLKENFLQWYNIMRPICRGGCLSVQPIDGGTMPASGRSISRDDGATGHTVERWLTYEEMTSRLDTLIRQEKNVIAAGREPRQYRIAFWQTDIACIDVDDIAQSEVFAKWCNRHGYSYGYEPSTKGGHFFFLRDGRAWSKLYTGLRISCDGKPIVIDICYGPRWLNDGIDHLRTRTGKARKNTSSSPWEDKGRYENGGRVVYTCCHKEACWGDNLLKRPAILRELKCSEQIDYLYPRNLVFIDKYPAIGVYEKVEEPKAIYAEPELEQLTLELGESMAGTSVGSRNNDFFRKCCSLAKHMDDALEFLSRAQKLNSTCPVPLPDREALATARSAWRIVHNRA